MSDMKLVINTRGGDLSTDKDISEVRKILARKIGYIKLHDPICYGCGKPCINYYELRTVISDTDNEMEIAIHNHCVKDAL